MSEGNPTPQPNAPVMSEAAKSVLRGEILSELNKTFGPTVSDLVEARYKALDEKREQERQEKGTNNAGKLFGAQPVNVSVNEQPKFLLGACLAAHTAGIAASRSVKGFQRYHDANPVEAAKKYACDIFGEQDLRTERFHKMVDPKGAEVQRAMAAGDFQDSGQFIIGQVRDTFTDVLRPNVIVFQLGPMTVPMPSGTMKLPRINADLSFSYQGEGQEPVPTKAALGELSLTSKECSGLIPISNKLLRRGGDRVNQVIERLAILRMGVVKDQALLRGNGTANQPKGLYGLAGNTLNVPQNPSFQQVLTTLGLPVSTLEQANVNITKGGWGMNPRIKNYLMFSVVNALGVPYFLDEIKDGTLLSFPYGTTTNIPSNLGADGTNAPVLFADWNYVVYGDGFSLNITMSTEASYYENGVVRNAFERDETLIRLADEHDIVIEHPEAAVVLGANTTGNGMSWA